MKLYIYGTRHTDPVDPRHDAITTYIDEEIDTVYAESAFPERKRSHTLLILLYTPLIIPFGLLYEGVLHLAELRGRGDRHLVDALADTYNTEPVLVAEAGYELIREQKHILAMANFILLVTLIALVNLATGSLGALGFFVSVAFVLPLSAALTAVWVGATAEARNQRMVQSILDDADDETTALLITGRDHVSGITALLDMTDHEYDHINPQ